MFFVINKENENLLCYFVKKPKAFSFNIYDENKNFKNRLKSIKLNFSNKFKNQKKLFKVLEILLKTEETTYILSKITVLKLFIAFYLKNFIEYLKFYRFYFDIKVEFNLVEKYFNKKKDFRLFYYLSRICNEISFNQIEIDYHQSLMLYYKYKKYV